MRTVKKIILLSLLLIGAISAYAQQTIKGTVFDPNKEPIIGAAVMVKGTTIGTATNIDGKFELMNVPQQGTLVVTFIGYDAQEVAYKAPATLSVIMKESVQQLNEVMVIGYGTVKKKDVTGSVVAIKAEELNKGAVTAPQQLIQGKIAGVLVTPGDGGPGSSSTIRIRGQASLNATNDPLIVIDGIPVAGNSAPGMANPLSTINPNVIETFTVLKDASATAIYGSRASNGVIIITTKKGGTDRPTVSYNSTYSANFNNKKVDMLAPDEFRQFITDNYPTLVGQMGSASTLWQDEVFRMGLGTDQNVSVTGNVKKMMPYRATVGYTNENGTLETSNFERYTGDVSLSPTFFQKHLTVNLNAKGVINNNKYADGGAVGGAAFFDPTQSVRQDYPDNRYNGYFTWETLNHPNSNAPVNPVALLEQVVNKSTVKRFLGNVQLDYKVHYVDGLRLNLNLGMDETSSNTIKGPVANSEQAWRDNDFPGEGRYSDNTDKRSNRLLETYIAYDRDFGKHHFDAMAGYSWQHFYESGTSDVYSNTNMTHYSSTLYKAENYLISFFGRLNYVYDSKYLLTASFRNDGSSRFAKGKQWGLFPSAALAWTISQEDFLKENDVLSNLKLRLGYGQTGQQDLGTNYYPFLARYNLSTTITNQYFLGDTFYSVLKPDAYDENITWETTETYNVGIDFGFLNGRFTGSVDAYYRNTYDLLNEINVPIGANFSNSLTTNVGSMTNKGIEVALNGEVLRLGKFTWDLGLNATYQQTKIDKLTAIGASKGTEVGGITGGTGNKIQMQQVNYAPYTFLAFQQVYDVNGQPIQNTFVDRDGDGIITDNDRYLGKKPAPDFYFGVNSQFKYGNWDLGFNLRGSIGNYMYNNFQSANSTTKVDYSKGFLTNVPRVAFNTGFNELNNVNQFRSDYFIEDASFLKMDNITLGYTFKNIARTKLGLRVYGAVQNVFTITKYSGLDPEGSGIDNNIWPRPLVATIGLNFNF